jgi:hypothetical protein
VCVVIYRNNNLHKIAKSSFVIKCEWNLFSLLEAFC